MTLSSFDGVISEIPGISVDNFERQDCIAYFLTHCHTDHTQGLSDTSLIRHLTENDVKIYMSDVTAAIIGGIPCYDGVKKFFHPLTLDSTTTIELPGKYEPLCVEIKLVPAGHCFGSVMFLFRTEYHTVLFTGDFRIRMNDVSKMRELHDNGQPIRIDKMYVDTTFIDCDYEDFPKRSESVECVIKLIKEWLDKDPKNCIALHPSARFGYEYVFNEIYKQLAMKVAVQDEDWAIYSKFPNRVPGVTNIPSRIHKCRYRKQTNHALCNSICGNYPSSGNYPESVNNYPESVNNYPESMNNNPNSLKNYPESMNNNPNSVNNYSNTMNNYPTCGNGKYLYINLSAMRWRNHDEGTAPHNSADGVANVCFATHSSRAEVIHFVTYYSPGMVVGFPKPFVIGGESEIEKQKCVQRPFFEERKRRKTCTREGGKRVK